MTALAIIVYGTPAPQGSKRHVGNGVMVESSKHVRPWREAVKAAVRDTVEIEQPFDFPLIVDMIFTFRRPAGHWRTGRNAGRLRDSAPPRPDRMPDLSKLARSTEDAITDAGVWVDDARVVEYGRLAKVYANEDADALNAPGAVIRIRPAASAPGGTP